MRKSGENLLSKRKFTVQAIKSSEMLTLHFSHLDRMKHDF